MAHVPSSAIPSRMELSYSHFQSARSTSPRPPCAPSYSRWSSPAAPGRHRNSRSPESPGSEERSRPTQSPISPPSRYSAPIRATSSCRYRNTADIQAPTTHYSPPSRFLGVRRFGYRSCLRATSTRSSRRTRPDDLPPLRPIPPRPRHPSSHSTSLRHTTISDRTWCRIQRRPTFRHRSRPCHTPPTTLVRSNRRRPGFRAIICRRKNRPLYSLGWRRHRGPCVRRLRPTFRPRWRLCRR